ncbi:MAG: CPBP family intramembrane metalloprotease [Clostridia bacterium]|nr:CPBP family intramembrane metalloprotease [Clostridia bacterium]
MKNERLSLPFAGRCYNINLLSFFLVTVLSSFAAPVFGFLASGGGEDMQQITEAIAGSDWYVWAVQVLLYVVIGCMMLKEGRRQGITRADVDLDRAPRAKTLILSAVFGIALLFSLSVITYPWQMLLQKIGYKTAEISVETPVALVGAIIGLGILPAVIEEYIYRGVIFNAARAHGVKFGICASAVMFSLMHCNPAQLANTLICGLIFAVFYYVFDNLCYLIVMHLCNNLGAILITYLDSLLGLNALIESNGTAAGIYWAINGVSILLCIGMLVYLVIAYREKISGEYTARRAADLSTESVAPSKQTVKEGARTLLSSSVVGILITVCLLLLNIVSAFL